MTPFPLAWPQDLPRSKGYQTSQFRTELPTALKNVSSSLLAFGRDSGIPVTDIVISSNVTLGVNTPADPGVAVWFNWDGQQRCIGVDRYTSPRENLQAIHHVLEARRTELRHGTLALVRATFRGFVALPAPKQPHEILGVKPTATPDEIKSAYRARIGAAHPDQGGTHASAAELNAARDAMLKGAAA